jgi:hypothetical protein
MRQANLSKLHDLTGSLKEGDCVRIEEGFSFGYNGKYFPPGTIGKFVRYGSRSDSGDALFDLLCVNINGEEIFFSPDRKITIIPAKLVSMA